jgi:hypothetical protein
MDEVTIARCPQHGLHGARQTCFACGGPVEQVAFVPAERLRAVEEEVRLLGVEPFLIRAAERLYAECERAITAGRIDARSPIGDATLDYRQMREEADERLARRGGG